MDIQMATAYARHMILDWGMSERLGFVRYAPDDSNESLLIDKDYSPETARIIDEEVKAIIDAAYSDAERLIGEHWKIVTAIAEALLKYETLQSGEVATLIEGGTLNRPTVADLLDVESTPPPNSPETPVERSDLGDEPDGLLPTPA